MWNIITYKKQKHFFILVYLKNVIYSCDGKAEFLAIYSHSSSVSHDPSEIILICWFGAFLLSLLFIFVYFFYFLVNE